MSAERSQPGPVRWLLGRHAWLLGVSLLIMLAAPYLGSLPVRTIPAVVALASRPEPTAQRVSSGELASLLGERAGQLGWVLGLLVLAGVLSFLLALTNTRVGARLSSLCARDLRARLHEVMLGRPPAYMRQGNRAAELRNALITQARVVASFAANTVPACLGVLFAVLIWAQTLYSALDDAISGFSAAALVGGVVLLLVLVNLLSVWISGHKSQAGQREVMQQQTAFIGLVGESVDHLETLQLDLAEPAQTRRLGEILQRMDHAEVRVATWSGLSSAASSGVVLLGIPLLVLAWQALGLDGAHLAVMIPALMMLQRSIASIGSLWTNYKVAQPSLDLVAGLLAPEPSVPVAASAPTESREPGKLTDPAGPHGQLEFRDLCWSAPGPQGAPDDAARPVLTGISFTVAPGETVALVGAGGSGKSTLLRLCLRILEPDAGTILLDAADISRLPLAEVRVRIGILAQQPAFFARSVRDNLLLDDRAVDDARLLEVAEATQLAEVLARLPGGLAHVLPPGGGTLSGSEKRRLALTRLLLRDPDIILIDELEAGLPQAQAQDIFAAVRHTTPGKTCLMVTHRPDLMTADRVVFIHEGRVADIGTHAELEQRCPEYRSLLARRREHATE